MSFNISKNKQAFGQTKKHISSFGKNYEYESNRNKRRKQLKEKPLTKEELYKKQYYEDILIAWRAKRHIPEIKFVKIDKIDWNWQETCYKHSLSPETIYEFLQFEEYSFNRGVNTIIIKDGVMVQSVPCNSFIPIEPTEEELIVYIMRKEVR